MLELARERVAGSHTYFVPVEHTRAAREALGPAAVLAVEQGVVLEADPVKAREQARLHMSHYLTRPNYVNNLLRHGFTEDDVREGGSDRLVDAVVAWGDETRIAERVAAQQAAGADHVCLQVLATEDPDSLRRAWRRLAEGLL
jgi:probable F420-dependent oxidoreductase